MAVSVEAVAGIVMSGWRAPPSDQLLNVRTSPSRVTSAGAETDVW
jgi:hypothetical protein